MTKYRMVLAEEMLSVGEHSIKEIASLLGYRNQLFFLQSSVNVMVFRRPISG